MNQIRNTDTKITSIILLIFLILPTVTSFPTPTFNQLTNPETKDLHLLRVEHYLELEAKQNTQTFNVCYAFPPDYGYQVPIVLQLLNQTTADVITYKIEPDGVEPNRVVNFTLGSMQKDEHTMLHFTIWVLVEDQEFTDIPQDISLPPSKEKLPIETQQWLSRSDMVQIHRLRIKHNANKLEGTNDNILSYAQNVSTFIKEHRYGFFLIQLWTRNFFKQDAMTTLRINGENVGRAHLACALLRTQNIPARVILANNDQGFWTQMHYMAEYFIPDYGWVLLDTTNGKTPYATHRQIINRICSINDEQDTKHDYIYRFMRGEERWIWISDENVQPYYVDCKEASKSQMFPETMVTLQPFASDYAFFRTQNVFTQYEKYLGSSLSTSNQQHVEHAIDLQIQACNEFAESENINEYVFYLEKAYDEYKAIE